jgi:hypothetical protein
VAWFVQGPGPQLTPALDYGKFDWSTPGASRRSIYRTVWRGIADPFMEALDFPDMGMLAPVRSFSASSLQALALRNNAFVLYFSGKLAASIKPGQTEVAAQITALFRTTLLRSPREAELTDFTKLATDHGLAAAARVLLNMNEFLFVD